LRLSIFDDRLEVENPGLLPFGLTLEDLPRGVSKLRNRVLGRIFHALGLVEQWGSGIQRMTAACREAGLAAPVFEELATRFRLSLMFYKRLCDQWECEADDAIAELERQQGRAFSDKEKAVFRNRGEHRFQIPDC